jgi:hypothetical protein
MPSSQQSLRAYQPKAAWENVLITFGHHFCLENLMYLGRLPLAVSHVIANTIVHEVLIDGGNSLGIITTETLKKMQVPSTYILQYPSTSMVLYHV